MNSIAPKGATSIIAIAPIWLLNSTAYFLARAQDEAGNIDANTITLSAAIGAFVPRIARTGQTLCYATASGSIAPCSGTGQDGDTLRGGEWVNPRFTDQGNSTMLDNNTSLIWSKAAKTPGPAGCTPGGKKNWLAALAHIDCLNAASYLGFNDWRLPNKNELSSLLDLSQADIPSWLIAQGFLDILYSQSAFYWTSSSWPDTNSPNSAWYVDIPFGSVGHISKTTSYYIWPLRSGLSGSFSYLPPRTGQPLCYDSAGATISCAGTGQDADVLKGSEWSSPRFTDLGDGTMQDNNTGIIWLKDAGTPAFTACTSGGKNWKDAFDYIQCLNAANYLGYADWRLPNRNELASLVVLQQSHQSSWLVAQGFVNVKVAGYWSSSVYAFSPNFAWKVVVYYGDYTTGDKSSGVYYSWPVRGGM